MLELDVPSPASLRLLTRSRILQVREGRAAPLWLGLGLNHTSSLTQLCLGKQRVCMLHNIIFVSWGFRPVLFCAARWKRSHALSGEMSLHISLLSCAGINVLLSAAGHCCSLAFGSRIASSLVCSGCYAATGIPRLICLEKEIHEEAPKGICGRMYSRFSQKLGFVPSWNPDTGVVNTWFVRFLLYALTLSHYTVFSATAAVLLLGSVAWPLPALLLPLLVKPFHALIPDVLSKVMNHTCTSESLLTNEAYAPNSAWLSWLRQGATTHL